MAPKCCICVFFVALSIGWSSGSSTNDIDDQLVVRTATATLRGKRFQVHPYQLPNFRESVSAFTSIPYAQPPVGEFRFARPVPNVLHGEFDATRESTACPQVSSEFLPLHMKISEDCLYLDVFVPEPRPQSAAVMVWIHGGGFHFGAGAIPYFLPTPLASFGNVIVVTVNYRLGPLGFLATGDDSIPANLGLLDQRQALIWVRDNIHAFGGDANRVTIFGESAGSASVNFHLLSKMSSGLFSRAIMQSGAINTAWSHAANMEKAVSMTFELGKAVGCDVSTSRELVACLRKTPVEDFTKLFENDEGLMSPYYVLPVADGQFLLDDPFQMSAEGTFNPADVMIGCLEDEGALFVLLAKFSQDGFERPSFNYSTFRQLIGMNLQVQDQLTIDMTAYVYSTPDQLERPDADYSAPIMKLMGDIMFLCPTFILAEQLAKADRNVYSYLMTHIPSHSMWGKNYTWLGATHGEDMPYVFGLPLLVQSGAEGETDLGGGFKDDGEVNISLQIMEYWTQFAKTGNPNLSTKDGVAEMSEYTTWPRFTSLEPRYKDLSATFENRNVQPDAKECYYLQNILPTLLENADEMTRLKSLLEEKVGADSEETCQDSQSCPEN